MSTLNDPRVAKTLDRLHAQSSAQNEALGGFFAQRIREAGALDWKNFDARTEAFMADKFVALERDKAELCYQLCRALRAKRVVEAGTSYGVSTLYLAAAVRDNLRADGGSGVVIATEHEPEKAKTARAHWAEAGLADLIELREGDLRETLKDVRGPIDFMLMDIWTPMARPALERVAPALRPGAIVVADNTTQFREGYADYFAFVNDPKHGFRTLTLPYEGGLELTVKL
jgi:predicted O-methyltransferase YrrM